MKTITILYKINLISLSIVVLCYASVLGIYLGAILELILGAIQIITALVIAFKYENSFNKKTKLSLKRYWILSITVICFVILNIKYSFIENSHLIWITYLLIPLLIATYFVRIIYLIQK